MNSFKKSYVDKLNKWKLKFTSETNHYRRQIDELERERNESLTKLQFLIEANKDFNRIIVMLREYTEKLEREKNEMSGKIEQLEGEGERFTDLFQKQPFVFKVMCGVIFLGISSDIRIVNRTCLVFFLCYMFVDRFL